MKQIFGLFAFVLLFSACQKNNNTEQSPDLYGRYRGAFTRTGMDTAQVSIVFNNDNTFEGTSDHLQYPALCGGSFAKNVNSLAVDDTCAWTANFDWTLIFDGNYNITFTSENSVRIWRTNGAITDEYLLTRFTR
jgi:hypothetical protein